MSEKSDPEFVPDEAEPWDNRPDAVADWRAETYGPNANRGAGAFMWGEHKVIVAYQDEYELAFNSHEEAVRAAHAILSEVEIAQRQPEEHDRPGCICDITLDNTDDCPVHRCQTCNGTRTIAVAGPDENGQYDTDDCPACSAPPPKEGNE